MDPTQFQRASSLVTDWAEEIGCLPPISIPYKSFGDDKETESSCFVDIYLPIRNSNAENHQLEHDVPLMPAVLYFHAGGMTVGNRRCWLPTWMLKRAIKAGYAFLSADYRLMPPATGHDILQDIRDLFRFLVHDLDGHLDLAVFQSKCKIDPKRIVVAGSSAGSFCAYLAAIHATPKPVAVLSMYGMGGDVLIPQYLSKKTTPFFMGREILDITSDTFRPFLHPFPPSLKHTATSSLSYDPTTGIPTNPRMPLCRLLLQEGVWLDYWTGLHDQLDGDGDGKKVVAEGFGRRMRRRLELDGSFEDSSQFDAAKLEMPPDALPLLPQFNITPTFLPTFLVHGELDSAVHRRESENLKRLLDLEGVKAQLRVVPGQEHSFDYNAASSPEGPEPEFGELFDEMFAFVESVLRDKERAV